MFLLIEMNKPHVLFRCQLSQRIFQSERKNFTRKTLPHKLNVKKLNNIIKAFSPAVFDFIRFIKRKI